MTRIVDLSLLRVRLRFREPVRYGRRMLASQEVGILRITTEAGLTGLGEVSGPVLPADLEETVERSRRALVGRDPADIDGIPTGVLEAAVATATLDVLGQQEGRSLADLLGGGVASVVVNGLLTIGAGTPEADATRACALVVGGFGTLKLKPVVGAERAAVAGSLRAIRATVGPDIGLRLDLNGDLTERAAIAWLTTLDAIELEYVEEPVPAALGIDAMTRVRAAVPMALAADESVTDRVAAQALLDAGACDVLVVKPSRVGGPMVSRDIAHAAATAGVAVTISTLYDSGVGLCAALHVAATIPGDRAHGLGTGPLLESDLIEGDLPVVDGRMTRPIRPGLGITLDAEAVAGALVVR
jgi:L-Ala-D/L-Glu epimerase